jgi:citrate synthase
MSSAVGTLSGPLHGGAPARVLPMIDGAERAGDPEQYVRDLLDRGERIMGFGHRIYRAYDPRATVLKRTAFELGAPKAEVAAALEEAALKVLREKSPDRQLETNVEYWAAVVLDFAGIPADLTPAMFGCARVAGWSAHILEQKRTGRLIRPGARYIGPAPRPVSDVSQ